MTLAAGLACDGLRPVVAIYSTFLQRAYDQLIHDVALQEPAGAVRDRPRRSRRRRRRHAPGRVRSVLPALHPEHGRDGAGGRERMPPDALHRPRRSTGPPRVRYPRGHGAGRTRSQRRCRRCRSAAPRCGARAAPGCCCSRSAPWSRPACDRGTARCDAGQHALREAARRGRWSAGSRRRTRAIVTLEENVVAGGAGSGVCRMPCQRSGSASACSISALPDGFIEHGSRERLPGDGRPRPGRHRARASPRSGRPTNAAAGTGARTMTDQDSIRSDPDVGAPTAAAPQRGTSHAIEDVQGRADSRRMPINKVGIKDIFHPVRVQRPLGRRAAHRRELQHVRGAAPQLQGHAHVALRRDPAPCTSARSPSTRSAQMLAEMTRAPRCHLRAHRDELPLLRHEAGARVSGVESMINYDATPDRRDPRRHRASTVDPRRRAGHQPLPVLEEDLRLRRAQPALTHHDRSARARTPLDRGADRHRRAGGVVRGLSASSSAPTRST